ncbi:hypothetical protein SLS53_002004 [Cytospora paraplurivora]|uniref:Uncharacterized protein n=1 Tax=Cytospora paraplurivora TaxID=2898453 RepID=A0AAN9UF99_9PEZI
MYGSYGSYSSTAPMVIPPSRRGGYQHSYLDDSCAFPSWPRRSSLGEGSSDDDQPRATAYISDEDLVFLSEPVFHDEMDARSVSSYGSGTPSSPRHLLGTAAAAPVRHVSEEALEEMRREQALRQRELIRVVMDEKERRRQAARAQGKQRKPSGGSSSSSSSASKKGGSPSPRSKLSNMTPIAEAAE